MNKKVKIALAIGIPLTLTAAYFLFLHKPSFEIKSINWEGKSGVAKLGRKELNFRSNVKTSVENKGYVLDSVPSKDTVTLNLFGKDGSLIRTQTIDFKSKLKY